MPNVKNEEWYRIVYHLHVPKINAPPAKTNARYQSHAPFLFIIIITTTHHPMQSTPQNSPPPLLPIAAAPQIPTNPQTPTLHPRHNPCTPCPLRIRLGRSKPMAFALAAFAASGLDMLTPSSRAMNHMDARTPRYGPGETIVLNSVLSLDEEEWPCCGGIRYTAASRLTSASCRTATCPLRRTVSNGSLKNSSAVELKKVPTE
jgi:hypothetical protein